MFPSYRNQPVDLHSKSMDLFLYGRDLRHERVKYDNILKLVDFEYARKK